MLKQLLNSIKLQPPTKVGPNPTQFRQVRARNELEFETQFLTDTSSQHHHRPMMMLGLYVVNTNPRNKQDPDSL